MQIFGLIGKNIAYSFSRKYFSEKFQKNNWIDKKYVNFDIESIEQVVLLFQEVHAGYNVTIPYKEKIIAYLEGFSEEALRVGAVNTVKVLADGKKIGYNTDYYGFMESLKRNLESTYKKALVLGNGGASKAIIAALEDLEIDFTVVARNPRQGEISFANVDVEMMKQYQIIINTTPLGTFPNINDKPDIPYAAIGENHLLYDLVYNPEKTAFLLEGEKRGATIKNGYEMLVLQAEKAWEIWNK